MAYTFLDNSLNTIGVLTNKGGQTNDYWGDSITHEIATSQDVLTSVSLSVDKPSVNIDTSGNQKTWNHVIQGLSFNIDGIGRKVNENDYLIYQEGTNGKYYLMAITQVDESAVQSGFHYKTVQGLNAAAYDLSRKTLRAKSFAQIPDNTQEKGTAQNILKYIFDGINWDVRTIGSFGAIDYEIAEGTTAQAVLLDIIGMFEAEVDAYVKLNNWGKGANVFNKNGSIKRIFDFSTSLGKYRGETVRYNKNMVSITKTGARDSMYTKLYVNGNGITIADVNKGADYIVDDVANRKYNKLGAVSTPVTYLEGIISNSAIESPTALLAWGKKQLKILNHPRYNYQISATNDDKVQLGDTVIIQDTHASDPIYLKSKVISKTVSLADPVNNSFIVGEFSPIVIGADNGLEDTNQIMQLVNQANQTAVKAQNKANENAQKIADTRTNLEKTIDKKLEESQDYADSLNRKVAEEQIKFNNQVNQELATAKSERDTLSTKGDQMIVSANSYADTMYSNAVSTAKDEASKALTSANEALDKAKTDLGGKINDVHSETVKNATEISGKVSQSDYNTKTNDLTTKYGQVKATADAVTTDVAKYKQTNDKKVSANIASIATMSDQITSKVSKTDFDKKTGDLNGKFTQQEQTVNSISQTVTELQAKANAQGQVNQLMNTEFNPDTEGWTLYADKGSNAPYSSYIAYGSRGIGFNTTNSDANTFARLSQTVILPSTRLSTDVMSLSWRVNSRRMDNYCHIWLVWQDDKGNKVADYTMGNWNDSTLNKHNVLKWENISIPVDAKQVDIRFETREGTQAYIFQPMLTFEKVVGDYVQGNYNNNSRVSALEVGLDGIIGTVNDPKKGLSATAKLASDGMSIATTAKNDATTAIQTARGTQTKVEQMGGINLLVNTEFNPDLEGWETNTSGTIKEPHRSYWQPDTQATTVGWATQNGSASSYARLRQDVQLSSTPGSGHQISMSWYSYTGQTDFYNNLWLKFYDKDNKSVGSQNVKWATTDGTNPSKQNSWNVQNKWEGIDVPDTAVMVNVSFEAREGTSAYLSHPMLVMGSTIGDYVAGNYNNNNSLESTRTQLAGQIADEIEDRTTGDKSVVTQMTGLIDQRVSKVKEGYESAISQSADTIMLSVSTPNNIINSEFENDLELQNDGSGIDGWTIQNPSSGNGKPAKIMNSNGYKNSNGLRVNAYTNNADTANAYYNVSQTIKVPHYVTQVSFNMMGYVYAAVSNSTTYINMNIEAKGPTGNRVGWIANSGNLFDTNKIGSWQEANNRLTNMTIPGGTDSLIINFYIRGRASVNFSQPILTFTSKKSEYIRGPRNNLTTNSVLQLQSDYFSLNLHTNSKNIITSINGDRNGVNITGKHITLDGDVSVTGDFYAKGGNFRNINAANITTNVASFFKSGFNDAFGSYATLDSNGMQIATDLGVTQYSGQSAWFYNKNPDHKNVLESIGRIGSNKSPWTPKNVDYMEIAVSTWRGTNGKNNGGDGIMFAAYDPDMVETKLLTWETKLSAGYNKLTKGWNFWDDINFNGNKINVPSADWGVSFTGMTLGQTHSTYPSIVDANAHKTGISFGLHEVYLIIDGKSYPMSKKIK